MKRRVIRRRGEKERVERREEKKERKKEGKTEKERGERDPQLSIRTVGLRRPLTFLVTNQTFPQAVNEFKTTRVT